MNITHHFICKEIETQQSLLQNCLSSPNVSIGDMVFQAVRTRFPLRIAAGMTELGLLQEPHILNPDNLRAVASRTETIQIQCLFCKEKDRRSTARQQIS